MKSNRFAILCAVFLVATLSHAQVERAPKIEIPFDYSYARFNPQNNHIVSPFSLNGGGGAVEFYFNRMIGIKADLQGYDSVTRGAVIPLGNPGCALTVDNAQPCSISGSGNLFTYNIGPVFKFRTRYFEPFVEAMGGGAHSNFYKTLARNCTGAACTTFKDTPSNNAWDFVIGGGFDIPVARHFSIRAAQVDYLLTRFGTQFTGGNNNQSSFRALAGFVLRLGDIIPTPANSPPTSSCLANPSTIFADSNTSVTLDARATDPDNDALIYAWTANAGTIEGSGPQVRWNPRGLASGRYSINVRVDDGRGGVVGCDAEVQIASRPNRPPTMSCIASPSSVRAGEPVRIIATANDPDNDALTFTWHTNGGQIAGTETEAQLNTAGLAPARYTVTGRVDDGRGGAADCQAAVSIQPPPEPPKPTPVELRLALRSVYFPTALPTASNPTVGLLESQQQILASLAGDFKQYLFTKPDARLTLEGHADPRGANDFNQALSARRVDIVKRFLVDQGIPETAIEAKAYGEEANLTPTQVTQMIQEHPNLSDEEKKKILANLQVVTLAQNRRVDIVLSNTGQRSLRQYPFNAVDSLTLLSSKAGGAK